MPWWIEPILYMIISCLVPIALGFLFLGIIALGFKIIDLFSKDKWYNNYGGVRHHKHFPKRHNLYSFLKSFSPLCCVFFLYPLVSIVWHIRFCKVLVCFYLWNNGNKMGIENMGHGKFGFMVVHFIFSKAFKNQGF